MRSSDSERAKMPGASRRNNDNASSWSAISEIAKEFLLPSARVSDTKLQEIPKEDNVGLIVDYIREEILQSVGDTIYEGYLQKAVYSFVTNCVYEAWMRAFWWAHLEYDDQEVSPSDSQISDETDGKDPRLRRGVPTVYGRLEKSISVRKSPNDRQTTRTKGATRRKIKQFKKTNL